MAFDPHANLAISVVSTAPSPPTSGTSLTVNTGHGVRFPAVPFNATVWPVAVAPNPANAEIIRVTARTTDTLTILRAQEGTTARAIGSGDQIAASITAKTLTDVETEFATVARLNAPNTFTGIQRIESAAPVLMFYETGAPADARLWDIVAYGQTLEFRSLNDAANAVLTQSLLSRSGDLTLARDLYEKGRTTPLGHWIDGTSYIPAGWTGTYQYALTGRAMLLIVYISTTLGAPVPEPITINLPYVISITFNSNYSYYDSVAAPAAWHFGGATFAAGDNKFGCWRAPSGSFPAGLTYLSINCAVPIQ